MPSLQEMMFKAVDDPYQYYPGKGVDDENDALRHMLMMGQLTQEGRKLGESIGNIRFPGVSIMGDVIKSASPYVAKGLGYLHELHNMTVPENWNRKGVQSGLMDIANNAVGVELGQTTNNYSDLLNKALMSLKGLRPSKEVGFFEPSDKPVYLKESYTR